MRVPTALFAVIVLLLGGCRSMPEGVRQRFSPPEPQVRVFMAEEADVFTAAQRAVRQIGFRATRTGSAQGAINAVSDIQPANALGEARQFALEVKVRSYEAGRTEIAVVLREQQESASFAGATDIPLRQHGLYDSFFNAVASALSTRPVSEPVAP